VLPWLPAAASAPPGRPPTVALRAERRASLPQALAKVVARLGPRLVALLAVAALVLVAVTVGLVHAGTRTVTTPFLSYTAPAGWTAEPTDAAAPLDAPALTGRVHGPGYDCGGDAYVRGYAAAALLPADASTGSGPADRAERLARWFASASYGTPGSAPELTVAPPRPVRVPGPDGPVDATVTEVTTQAAGRGDCAARGTVLALAAPVSGGAALLLVAGEGNGGPAEPAPPDRATLDAVLASVRLSAS
jgi:hypothetical protein